MTDGMWLVVFLVAFWIGSPLYVIGFMAGVLFCLVLLGVLMAVEWAEHRP